MTVPRIIHQTWKTEDVPPAWQGFARSWRELHPGWEHRLWTDETNRAFVATYYPRLLTAYDGYRYGIQRADAIRYCLLHHFGGVYADLDVECLQPLEGLIETEAQCFMAASEPRIQGERLGRQDVVSNAFMISTPEHPFLAAVIEHLIATAKPGVTHRDVLESTGPLMLDSVRREYDGGDLSLLPSHVVFPFAAGTPELEGLRTRAAGSTEVRAALIEGGTYAVHYWANTWVGTLAGELMNPPPYTVAGFDFYPGQDSPGNDIANVGRNVREAAMACRDIAGAVGFNTDGFVKDALLPRARWQPMGNGAPDEGLYVLRRRGASSIVERFTSLIRRR